MSEHTITVAGVAVDTRHWIGGERVASAQTFPDVSPIDGSTIGEISRGTAMEAAAAVAAAKAAFPAWAATSRAERARILHAIADGVEKRIEELSIVETTDNGALLRSHRRGVMPRVAHNFRFFADWLLKLEHEDFETRGHTNHVSWDPAGPSVLITPWNAPLMLATWKVAPALAAGNTVILKPAEWTPLTASLLADIAAEAGLPAGVLNVVQGYGSEIGDALTSHPDVRRISFTGSVPTAKRIAESAAANLTPLSLELGGKSPLLVFADADLDLAVDLAVEQYDNAGQVCLAATRFLVEESVAEEFTRRFVEKAGAAHAGRPARRGHRHRAEHPPAPAGEDRRLRAACRGGRCPRGHRRPPQGRPVLRADPPHRRRPGLGDRAGGGLRPGPDPADLRHRGRGRPPRQRHPLRAGRHRSPPATPSAPNASPRSLSRARSGSTASSSATCRRRSAAPATPASAARAAPGASTSTATSRTP